ncbi:hypothetical protein C7212DRAFT_215806, partial [Tuber magnatum]
YILYLTVHSSHVLQPLDQGMFFPLKSCYWKEIADLVYLDNAILLKKGRFITAYSTA